MRSIDIVGLAVVAVLLVAVAIFLRPLHGVTHSEKLQVECMNNVRQIVGLVGVTRHEGEELYPGGAPLMVYLIEKSELGAVPFLFCPGDTREPSRAHRTSYASRTSAPRKGDVLICDATAEFHGGEGLVVAFAGGTVRWRDKVKHYGLRPDDPLVAGPDSTVAELRCLMAD